MNPGSGQEQQGLLPAEPTLQLSSGLLFLSIGRLKGVHHHTLVWSFISAKKNELEE